MKGEPILVSCEGSGCEPCAKSLFTNEGLCSMCGHSQRLDIDGRVVSHERDDLIARVLRGDFD